MAKQVEIEIGAAMSRYERGLQSGLKMSLKFDAQMRRLQNTIKGVDKQLNLMEGNVNVNVQADTSSVDRAEAKVGAIDGMTPDVTVSADSSALDTAESKVDAIDGMTPDVMVNADSSAVDTAQSKVDEVDGSTPKVTVQADSSALDRISQQIQGLNTTATLDLAINIAGGARNAFESTPILSDISDQQQAIRLLEAEQVNVLAGASAIETVWTNNWGQSRTEIAEIVAELQKLRVPPDQLEDAALSTYELTAAGRDLNEVLTSQNILVTTGVAKDYRDAANILATGLRGEAGTAEDFLDTIREYAPQLRELKLSAEGFLSYLNSGIAEGAWNTDKLADSLKEANVRIQEAVTDPATPYAQALQRVDQMDEAQAYVDGELTGEQFFEGLIAAVREKGTDFDLFEIFGSGAEDLGAEVLANVDFSGVTIAPDAASGFAAAITDYLGSDAAGLFRTLNDQFLGTLDTMTGGLDIWIEEVQSKIRTLGSELRAGESLPEALEIALEAPGLANQLRDIESSLSNFIIGLLDGLGQLIAIIPGANAEPIKNTVADLAAGQLAYDLEFAVNEQQIEEAVALAVSRGVTGDQISVALTDAVASIVEDGALIAAQTLTQQTRALVQSAEVTFTPTLKAWDELQGTQVEPVTVVVDIDPSIPPEERAAAAVQLAQEMDEVIALYNNGSVAQIRPDASLITEQVDATAAQEIIDQARFAMSQYATVAEDVGTSATPSIEALTGLNFQFSEMEGTADGATARADVTATAITNLGDDADTAGAQLALFYDGTATSSEDALARLAAAHDTYLPPAIKWWEEYQQKAYDAIAAAGGVIPLTPTAPPSGAGSGSAPGRAIGGDVFAGSPYTVGEQGRELFIPGADGFIIPHGLTEALLALPSMAGGGAITNNYNTVNANININSQGTAQLMGGASRMAKAIRGY